MAQLNHMAAQALTKQAADWVARLSGQPGEADWLAFEAWLDGGEARRAAYDRALALSLAVDGRAAALADRVPARAPVARASLIWSGGMVAVAAVAVTFAALHPRPEPKATTYATAKGERRDV